MKIIPLADRVVIKTVEVEETTKGGLILTGSAKEGFCSCTSFSYVLLRLKGFIPPR